MQHLGTEVSGQVKVLTLFHLACQRMDGEGCCMNLGAVEQESRRVAEVGDILSTGKKTSIGKVGFFKKGQQSFEYKEM